MGHLANLKSEYRELIARLDAGPVGMPEPREERARAGWQEILEILFTPEEAALAARIPLMPSTLQTIAGRVQLPPDVLKQRLEAMADKGIVLDLVHPRGGETKYLLSPPVVGFFEFSMMRAKDTIPKKRMAAALEAYFHGDDTFARQVFGNGTVIGRALVHETALDEDDMPDVLHWERATAVLDEARSIAVTLCYCRHEAEHLGRRCDAPIENCMSIDSGADFLVRRKFGRAIDKKEAMDILTASRQSGLVQIADNVRNRPTFICNCCPCCCGQLRSISDYGLPAVNASAFIPTVNLEKCKGCSRCSRACPITAISMVAQRTAAKRKNDLIPRIDTERCIGCGVCVDTCRNFAMSMDKRAERPYVPANALERVLRQSLERGRLADLLFDAGASRGSRFMNGLVRSLCALPPVEKALASEQVRSRFIRYALGNARDIDGI